MSANAVSTGDGSHEVRPSSKMVNYPAAGVFVVGAAVMLLLLHLDVVTAWVCGAGIVLVLVLASAIKIADQWEKAVVLRLEANPSVDAIGGPALDGGQGVAGEGDDMEDGGADTARPASGQRERRDPLRIGHGSTPEEVRINVEGVPG